jgi:hypothetical protein
MAQWTHAQYEALERAIVDGRRIAIHRRGTEYVVIPHRLRLVGARELVESVHPTTGEPMAFYVDEVDEIQIIK